jgi:hypothetical protein
MMLAAGPYWVAVVTDSAITMSAVAAAQVTRYTAPNLGSTYMPTPDPGPNLALYAITIP